MQAQDLMLKRDSTRNDSQSSKSFAPISKEMKTLMIKKRAELFQMAMKERSRRLAQFPKAPRLFTGAANYDLTWFRTTYLYILHRISFFKFLDNLSDMKRNLTPTLMRCSITNSKTTGKDRCGP
mmetsp:Transcript_23966/g.38515  ORF Transcript_23966/g.38515 Transcript_23966/m.38515 type:complete len:124 (+) Transcript_23966:692-1063(+)